MAELVHRPEVVGESAVLRLADAADLRCMVASSAASECLLTGKLTAQSPRACLISLPYAAWTSRRLGMVLPCCLLTDDPCWRWASDLVAILPG